MIIRSSVVIILILIGIQAVTLFWFGQPALCECGYVKAWEGVVLSPGNSQHLTDWYTFSHILHGFVFYLGLWFFFPRMPVSRRLLLAIGIEVAWEIAENTPMVIQHYREQALAQGYTGDSVINSVFDTISMMLGFMMAWRWPVWTTIALGIFFELFVLYAIRDNLILNVINLAYPFETIASWQSG